MALPPTIRRTRPLPRTLSFGDGNGSVAAFVNHLVQVQRNMERSQHDGLERAAKLIERDARGQIGHYQAELGPFPAWAPLSGPYEDAKVRAGFKADSPLLRTGELRDSIGSSVSGNQAVIGARDEKMVWHEFGTRTMPPRPVFGPAVLRNLQAVQELLGDALIDGLLLGGVVPAGGYFGR